MVDPILSARNVQVRFDTAGGSIHAVRGVDLDFIPGETVAIVGESGAGKSAFAKAILHLHQVPFTPNRTHVTGEISLKRPFEASLVDIDPQTLRRVRAQAIGMIFQDALSALNPVQRIGPQVAEAIKQARPDTSPGALQSQVIEILDAIGLPNPTDRVRDFPHELSGGQCQRVMIAIAAVRHPVAIIADEPTTALDVTVQAQILRLLKALQDQRGMAMLFISHDLGVVSEIADRVLVMYQGEVVESGSAADVLQRPSHAYTKRLLASQPNARRRPSANAATIGARNGTGAVNGEGVAAPAIEADGVSFAYARGFLGGARTAPVVNNVSFSMQEGHVHGLVGESGSGKSTLGRLVLGFLKPRSGTIRTLGRAPHSLKGQEESAFRKAVQVVYQDSASALNPRLTLGRSAAEGLIIHGMSVADARAQARVLFDQVRLPQALMERFPHEVSGGQRQRVCIARALALKPRLLIADEPVTALDLSVQAQILDLFGELQADLGLSMLFISHDLGVVRALCDTVSVMHKGAIVEGGDTETVFDAPQTAYSQNLIASVPSAAWGQPEAAATAP